MNITVKLDIASGQLTINPDEDDVAADSSVTLNWVRDTSGDSFTFTSLTGLPSPPFSNLNVNSGGISVNDNNTIGIRNVDYPYALVVTGSNGIRYAGDANNGNPSIRNR